MLFSQYQRAGDNYRSWERARLYVPYKIQSMERWVHLGLVDCQEPNQYIITINIRTSEN